jgi:hypothetical protein
MLCARDERLEDLLVRAIIESGTAKAEDLQRHIAARGGTWSVAATYKALRKLVENGVLVHSKSRYYIAQSWIFSLSHLIDRHLELPLHDNGGEHLLPPSGGQFSWRYTDLRRLNSFASNIILVAARSERVSIIYSWSPHLWFNLVHQEHEKRYYSSLRNLGTRVIKLIGGDTPLDRETASALPKSVVATTFLPYRNVLPRNHYTIVVESFVITMKLQRRTADDIDTLFHRAKDLTSIDTQLLLKIFRYDTSPSTLTIEHNRAKAEQLRAKIAGRSRASKPSKV